jgi:hypothetical protein
MILYIPHDGPDGKLFFEHHTQNIVPDDRPYTRVGSYDYWMCDELHQTTQGSRYDFFWSEIVRAWVVKFWDEKIGLMFKLTWA